MATESSEGEEEAKLTGGNKVLMVDDDLREMGKKVRRCTASPGKCSIPEESKAPSMCIHLHNIHLMKAIRRVRYLSEQGMDSTT
ncbi:hypothetical protein FEM48_Zijuj04G0068100 [Ziziphus jujuba var. spinosa]|uniref:Uncharacterized protein n=1 Tax=Ziziphus jujuba var. spinosa TaxID=714518 RepID=A0A978VIE8_ZIZJJ|nr:hypothetical protein FEM48_Zijuj04G0068100 [Ziziphus jujuba var. spinosa]